MTNLTEMGWNIDNSYAGLPTIFFTKQNPLPVREPKLVILNESLAKSLGLGPENLKTSEGVSIFAGNRIPDGSLPLAQAYAGHQFGHFTMLGDGRAILLGEQITPNEERFDIQLKGPGRTAYSRGGDGRAALGPMLREYIISEAMHGLGIPTTRSLAVVTTGEKVYRELPQIGAILTRVASSHLRVGTFEYASKWGTVEELRTLADYTIKRHYPEIFEDDNKYLSFLKSVIRRQAQLIAKWQLVGFIHGVMNTDNMTISGETIDYGPCAFMDVYDPDTVFSSIDRQGRYAYGNQPNIAGWNLARLSETLLPLINEDKTKAIALVQESITNFSVIYEEAWLSGMRTKLGIYNEEAEDKSLADELLNYMVKKRLDYTNIFRSLTHGKMEDNDLLSDPEFVKWYELWHLRLGRQKESKESAHSLMRSSNPAVIPRNHRVEEALKAAENGDYSVMERLIAVLKNPFAYSVEQEEYSKLPEQTKRTYRTFCGT